MRQTACPEVGVAEGNLRRAPLQEFSRSWAQRRAGGGATRRAWAPDGGARERSLRRRCARGRRAGTASRSRRSPGRWPPHGPRRTRARALQDGARAHIASETATIWRTSGMRPEIAARLPGQTRSECTTSGPSSAYLGRRWPDLERNRPGIHGTETGRESMERWASPAEFGQPRPRLARIRQDFGRCLCPSWTALEPPSTDVIGFYSQKPKHKTKLTEAQSTVWERVSADPPRHATF